MTTTGHELVDQVHRQALEQLRLQPFSHLDAVKTPTDLSLPAAIPGTPFATEWEILRHELSRLLAQGNRGRFALIRAGHPLTVWDTLHDAVQAGELLYNTQACLVQQITPCMPSLRAG